MSDQNKEMNQSAALEQNFSSRDRQPRGGVRRKYFRHKVCKICVGKVKADFKDPETLRRFITDRGKILPRRITGTCAKHQRSVTREIKRSRSLALLPFVSR